MHQVVLFSSDVFNSIATPLNTQKIDTLCGHLYANKSLYLLEIWRLHKIFNTI